MLTIWGRKTSSNVQALMWCVGELGLDYLRFDVGHHYGGTDSEAFYMILPSNHGPAIARILSSGKLKRERTLLSSLSDSSKKRSY